MTNELTPKTDQVRPQESSTSPSSSFTFGDPVRRDFGDKTDNASKKTDPSQATDKSAKNNAPHVHGNSGSGCSTSGKEPEVKPAGPLSERR